MSATVEDTEAFQRNYARAKRLNEERERLRQQEAYLYRTVQAGRWWGIVTEDRGRVRNQRVYQITQFNHANPAFALIIPEQSTRYYVELPTPPDGIEWLTRAEYDRQLRNWKERYDKHIAQRSQAR
jgi:hypothetical protein